MARPAKDGEAVKLEERVKGTVPLRLRERVSAEDRVLVSVPVGERVKVHRWGDVEKEEEMEGFERVGMREGLTDTEGVRETLWEALGEVEVEGDTLGEAVMDGDVEMMPEREGEGVLEVEPRGGVGDGVSGVDPVRVVLRVRVTESEREGEGDREEEGEELEFALKEGRLRVGALEREAGKPVSVCGREEGETLSERLSDREMVRVRDVVKEWEPVGEREGVREGTVVLEGRFLEGVMETDARVEGAAERDTAEVANGLGDTVKETERE